MNAPDQNSAESTRRQFIRRTVSGASLLGLGSATGLLASTDKPSATPDGAKSGRTLGKEFSYNLSPLTKVDPKLVRYEEKAAIPTGFSEVRGLAMASDDRLFVAGDQAIRIFNKNGERVSEIRLDDQPRCLALSKSGVIYVGMSRHVETFNAQGVRQAKWEKLNGKAVITSIAVAEQDVFLADAGNRIVLRYDLTGKLLKEIGKKDLAKNIPGFSVPSPYFHLAVGTDGFLWVVNPARHRLEAYTFEGELETSWGESANAIHGFCGCCNPIHFTRLSDGRFVTSEKGLPRVKIYSAKGDFECVVAAPELFPKQLENPKGVAVCMDLAVNSAGHILLADAVTREIRIFSPKQTSEMSS